MPKIPDKPSRPERLALNVFDLTDRVPKPIRLMLLAGKIDTNVPIYVDRERPDEVACPLTCPLLDAACICDMLTSECRKLGQPEVRVYLGKPVNVWARLPYGTVLTETWDGGVRLAEAVFPTKERELVAPTYKPELQRLEEK